MTGNMLKEDILGLLDGLSSQEAEFVMSRSRSTSDAEAYRKANISKGTYYTWPSERRDYLCELAEQVRRDRYVAVEMKLRMALESVVDDMIAMAGSRKVSTHKRWAMERILDETLGRPSQRVQLTGGDGGAIQVTYVNDWRANGSGD